MRCIGNEEPDAGWPNTTKGEMMKKKFYITATLSEVSELYEKLMGTKMPHNMTYENALKTVMTRFGSPMIRDLLDAMRG